MTSKKLIRAGLTGLAVLAVGALLIDPSLAQAPPAPAEPTVNKGDTAWMLSATVFVLLMTISRALPCIMGVSPARRTRCRC
jgi:hypothetical protein